MDVPQINPSLLLPPYQETLTEEQTQKVQRFLQVGSPVTNFDVQRVLFGQLNKECGVAIKNHLLSLVAEGKVIATGQKRGRRYQWVSE